MRIKNARLANLRAFDYVEFAFHPQVNLIVGVNGVGKSTVLDALRICLSRILPRVTQSKARPLSFSVDDIRSGAVFTDVDITIEHDSREFRYTRRQWREKVADDDLENINRLKRHILDTERLRERKRNLLRELSDSQRLEDVDNFAPTQKELKQAVDASGISPSSIFFSTNRSVVSERSASGSDAAGGEAAAYAEALLPRPLYLAKFADWMRVQQALSRERPLSARHLEVMRRVINQFLSGFKNLRPDFTTKPRLLIDKDEIALDVRQLSDGERGVLALVIDIARRLSQANPNLEDPLGDSEAIILIDEIDLHLHPQWQRQIMRNLTSAFPRCQFIATTHSPQVIGEVNREQIYIISSGEVFSPTHSFGVDSSRVLEEVMETRPRTIEVQDLLTDLSGAIGKDDFETARNLLVQIEALVGQNDPEVTRARTLLEFLEG